MSLNFSANQYNKAYNPYNLQNWELPREHRERPRHNNGFTQFIANNKGHLMDGVPRCRESPWGNFVGTWDLPIKIPGNKLNNPTARSYAAADNLLQMKSEGDEVIKGQTKHVKVPDPLPIKEDIAADNGIVTNQDNHTCKQMTPLPSPPTQPTSMEVNTSNTHIDWPASRAARH